MGDEEVKFLAGPYRANQNADKKADGDSNCNGGEPSPSQLEQFIHTVARECNQAECEDKYCDAIIELHFDSWDESREGCC